MYLRQESYDAKYPKVRVIKEQKNFGLQQYVLYDPLETIIEQSSQYPKYQQIFLLEDQRFQFFYFEITKDVEVTITYQDVQKLIAQKIAQINQTSKEAFLFSVIDEVKVNGKPQKFLVGKKGEISCRVTLVYLNRMTLLSFNDVYGDVFNQKQITILPKHFYTVEYLKKHLKISSCLLLSIEEMLTEVIQIEDGKYHKIESINLGINTLMQMYKDNGITKYRYKDAEEIEENPYAKGLVVKTLQFYAKLLCKRLEEMGMGGTTVFLISPIIQNIHFMEIFNETYTQRFTSYIVPLHIPDNIETYGKQRELDDIDALIYLNTFQLVKKEGLGL